MVAAVNVEKRAEARGNGRNVRKRLGRETLTRRTTCRRGSQNRPSALPMMSKQPVLAAATASRSKRPVPPLPERARRGTPNKPEKGRAHAKNTMFSLPNVPRHAHGRGTGHRYRACAATAKTPKNGRAHVQNSMFSLPVNVPNHVNVPADVTVTNHVNGPNHVIGAGRAAGT